MFKALIGAACRQPAETGCTEKEDRRFTLQLLRKKCEKVTGG